MYFEALRMGNDSARSRFKNRHQLCTFTYLETIVYRVVAPPIRMHFPPTVINLRLLERGFISQHGAWLQATRAVLLRPHWWV